MREINADTPLHSLNPLDRFSDRAEDYAKYRPSYPTAAIDCVLSDQKPLEQRIAADVGAGTGISARLLGDRGIQVWAIEPNAAMRDAAVTHPLVTYLNGTAEQTGLKDASVDVVTCFQAFHWFDPHPTLNEFHRILKSTGKLAVVWNNRDPDDPFTTEYTRLVQELSNYHPAESKLLAADPLSDHPLFQLTQHETFAYEQPLDLDGLIGRVQSVSYIPKDAATQQKLLTGLQALYDRWADVNGNVHLSYRTDVFIAKPQPS